MRAFMLGFEVADAIALLRLDDLYIGECGWRRGRLYAIRACNIRTLPAPMP